MADRQDIDALIVGALYGELDAADRARLETHLSSHPEDRAALEALERTRATVRRGLAEMPAAEPNPAISTILLREAGRLAPTPGRAAGAAEPAASEGLWARFVRWARPVALHPAFAGAAALLLVASTATALWMRDKGGVTEPEAPHAAAPATAPASPPGSGDEATAALPSAPPEPAAAGEQEYRVDLDQTLDGKDLARDDRGGADGNAVAKAEGRTRETRDVGGAKKRPAPSKAKGKKSPEAAGYLDVQADKSPVDIKDLPAKDSKADEKLALPEEDDAADSRGSRVAKQGQAAGSFAPAPEPKPADPALEQWAQTAHSRLVKLVADGKCPEAGRVGAEIKDRAPEYYAANVANDRAIRACKSYIEGQAKKKAEKNYKSRSQTNTVDAESAADTSK